MSDTLSTAGSVSEDLPTNLEGSQPSTDKATASPEEKKAYALDKRFSKLTGDIKSKDTQIANQDKELLASVGKTKELEAQIAELTAPKAPNADLELDNPEEFTRQSAVFQAHELSKVETKAIEKATALLRKELETERKQDKLRQEQEQFAQKADSHVKKGQAIGLTEEDLLVSASVLANAGVPNDVQTFLFDDPEGPQIMDFLANNPKELEALTELPALNQAAHIERVIRAQAISNKPTVTGAPDPLLSINGGGMRETEDFEKLCPGAEFK